MPASIAMRLLAIATACLAAGLAGCAATSPAVRVDKAEVDLAKCQTFGWLPATQDAASLTEQRVRTAAMRELQEKGYAHSEEQPDCRITYVLAIQEQPPRKPRVGVGAGGGSGGVRGGVGVSIPVGDRNRHTGEFTIDVIDAGRNAQIWSGSLDAAFGSAELTQEEADEVVRRVLAEFPDNVAGSP